MRLIAERVEDVTRAIRLVISTFDLLDAHQSGTVGSVLGDCSCSLQLFENYQDVWFTSAGMNHDLQLTEGYLFTVMSLGKKLDNDVHYESIPSTMWEEGGRRTTPQLRTGISEKQWRRKLAYLEDLKKEQEQKDASAAEFRLKNLTGAPDISIDALKRF